MRLYLGGVQRPKTHRINALSHLQFTSHGLFPRSVGQGQRMQVPLKTCQASGFVRPSVLQL